MFTVLKKSYEKYHKTLKTSKIVTIILLRQYYCGSQCCCCDNPMSRCDHPTSVPYWKHFSTLNLAFTYFSIANKLSYFHYETFGGQQISISNCNKSNLHAYICQEMYQLLTSVWHYMGKSVCKSDKSNWCHYCPQSNATLFKVL